MSINSEKQPNIRGEVVQLRRIADAMEEILKLVKADQERSKKYMEKEKADEGNFADGR